MAFTGKTTQSGGATLPELMEDVADLVAVLSPTETPLLDALGDPGRVARSVLHEWMEDATVPDSSDIVEAMSTTQFEMADDERYRVGDQIRLLPLSGSSDEIMLITAKEAEIITVTRGYGGTTVGQHPATGDRFQIIANASIEGADAGASRFTVRQRKSNVTQIFTSTISLSGTEQAVRQAGVADELEYQKAMRLREVLAELEKSVINGVQSATVPLGSDTTARTLRGIVPTVTTNRFVPGSGGFPAGTTLTEDQLNTALRGIWENGGTGVDTIVVGGRQKRAINSFIASNRRFYPQSETYKDVVSVYESDFGVCRVVMSRHLPQGTAILLDSSRISVLPLAGRSFAYQQLAKTGDHTLGQIVGEYTVEVRNESAHGIITGLAA